MHRVAQIGIGALTVLISAGCRSATKVTEVPRVDLELSGGNRGYLVGTPPPASAEMTTTRKMVWTDIELPSFTKPTARGTAPVSVEVAMPPEAATAQEPADGEAETPARHDTYVVQKGDSLSTIAAKPEIYGKGSQWRRIFDANRGLLKSSDRVRAGMTLKIPRGEYHKKSRRSTTGNKGILYKK